MYASLTVNSENRKTGKIPVSMTSKDSCPPTCGMLPFCYAKTSNLGCTWEHLSQGNLASGISWESFCEAVRALPTATTIWRHNQAGDLPGFRGKLSRPKCLALAQANNHHYNRGGFTYTHYAPTRHNRAIISEMIELGFAINLSADSLGHADYLAAFNVAPVAVVLPSTGINCKTPEGRTVMVCPHATRGIQCCECRLCQKLSRKTIIGLPAHGVFTKRINAKLL
jgi:hypothetical protein